MVCHVAGVRQTTTLQRGIGPQQSLDLPINRLPIIVLIWQIHWRSFEGLEGATGMVLLLWKWGDRSRHQTGWSPIGMDVLPLVSTL